MTNRKPLGRLAGRRWPELVTLAGQVLHTVSFGSPTEEEDTAMNGLGSRLFCCFVVSCLSPGMSAQDQADRVTASQSQATRRPVAAFTRNWYTTPWPDASGRVLEGPHARRLNAGFLKR